MDEKVRTTNDIFNFLESQQDRLSENDQKWLLRFQDWFYEEGRPLTTKQYLILESIYEKYI